MIDRQVGDVLYRCKVRPYDHQGQEAYSMVAYEQDPRWGRIMRDLREDEVKGELVHYFDGYGEPLNLKQSDGSSIPVTPIKVRLMYEPYEGEPKLIK